MPNLVIEGKAYPVPYSSTAPDPNVRGEENAWIAMTTLERLRRVPCSDSAARLMYFLRPVATFYGVDHDTLLTAWSRHYGVNLYIQELESKHGKMLARLVLNVNRYGWTSVTRPVMLMMFPPPSPRSGEEMLRLITQLLDKPAESAPPEPASTEEQIRQFCEAAGLVTRAGKVSEGFLNDYVTEFWPAEKPIPNSTPEYGPSELEILFNSDWWKQIKEKTDVQNEVI